MREKKINYKNSWDHDDRQQSWRCCFALCGDRNATVHFRSITIPSQRLSTYKSLDLIHINFKKKPYIKNNNS